jgi:hypothetical protein
MREIMHAWKNTKYQKNSSTQYLKQQKTTMTKVDLGSGKFSDEIPISRGVGQGNPLSSTIFIIVINTLMEKIEEEFVRQNAPMFCQIH